MVSQVDLLNVLKLAYFFIVSSPLCQLLHASFDYFDFCMCIVMIILLQIDWHSPVCTYHCILVDQVVKIYLDYCLLVLVIMLQ